MGVSVNKNSERRLKKLKVGDICILKISAIGPKGIGIDEYSYGYSIFVPNGILGETVKAKIVKITLNSANPVGLSSLSRKRSG